MEARKWRLSKEDLQCEEKELEGKRELSKIAWKLGMPSWKKHAKLQAALKNKNFKEVSVAQAMIEGAQTKISTTNTGMQQAREQQRSVSKKK